MSSKALTALVVLCLLAPAARGAVVGVSPPLAANDDDLVAPQNVPSSGTLGDPLVGGKQVGLDETVTVLTPSASSEGFVEFEMVFDMSTSPDVLLAGATIQLRTDDLDFLLETHALADLQESIEITFLQDPGDDPGAGTALVLDDTNYGLFRADGFGPTSETDVTYSLLLEDDLGATQADIDDMNADGDFALFITARAGLTSTVDYTAVNGNSAEEVEVSFDFTPVPEPATLSLLAFGGFGLLLRRRR